MTEKLQTTIFELEPKIVRVFTEKIPTKSEDVVLKEFVTDLAEFSYSYPIIKLVIHNSARSRDIVSAQPKHLLEAIRNKLHTQLAKVISKVHDRRDTLTQNEKKLLDKIFRGIDWQLILQRVPFRDLRSILDYSEPSNAKATRDTVTIKQVSQALREFIANSMQSFIEQQKRLYQTEIEEPILNLIQPYTRTKDSLIIAAYLKFNGDIEQFLQNFINVTTVYFNKIVKDSYGFGSKLELFKGFKTLLIGYRNKIYLFTARKSQSNIQWLLNERELPNFSLPSDNILICKWFDYKALNNTNRWLISLLSLVKFDTEAKIVIGDQTQACEVTIDGLQVIPELVNGDTDIAIETNFNHGPIIKYKSALLESIDGNSNTIYQFARGVHYTLDKTKYTLFAGFELLQKRIEKIYSVTLTNNADVKLGEDGKLRVNSRIVLNRSFVRNTQEMVFHKKQFVSSAKWFDYSKKYKNPILQIYKAAFLAKSFEEFKHIVHHLVQYNTVTEDYDSLVKRGVDLFIKHLSKYQYQYYNENILREILKGKSSNDILQLGDVIDYLYEAKGLYGLTIDYTILHKLRARADLSLKQSAETFVKLIDFYYSYNLHKLSVANVQYKLNKKRLLQAYYNTVTYSIPLEVLYVEHVVLFPMLTVSPLLLQAYRVNKEDEKFISRLLSILS